MTKSFKLLTITVAGIAVISAIYLGFWKVQKLEGMKTAERVIKLMYEFDSYDDVYESNMKELKTLTTEDIYKEITVENVDRALTTYLKFKGHSSKVEIIDITDNYVMYSLDTESITQTRKFCMFYHTNWLGRIDKMQEAELRDFYKVNTTRSNA